MGITTSCVFVVLDMFHMKMKNKIFLLLNFCNIFNDIVPKFNSVCGMYIVNCLCKVCTTVCFCFVFNFG